MKQYIYTEKGAAAAKSHGAKAGDPYERPVSKSILRQYVKAGYIAEVKTLADVLLKLAERTPDKFVVFKKGGESTWIGRAKFAYHAVTFETRQRTDFTVESRDDATVIHLH